MANSPPERLGLRERKKKDAMARMQTAVRDLMGERGYDAATTKEIAAGAVVGEANLFRDFPF